VVLVANSVTEDKTVLEVIALVPQALLPAIINALIQRKIQIIVGDVIKHVEISKIV